MLNADLEMLKEETTAHVDRGRDQLLDVSHRIHNRPELSFEEHFAHDLLTSVLEDAGFNVESGAYGLETAFIARAGDAGPVVAVLCEYDALPGIPGASDERGLEAKSAALNFETGVLQHRGEQVVGEVLLKAELRPGVDAV